MRTWALAAVLAHPCWATSGNVSSLGATSAGFLEVGVGARAVSLGGAYTALADEAAALTWNPAALARVPKHSVSLMHAAGINGGYFDYAAASENLGAAGAVAAGVQYYSAGQVLRTDDATGLDAGFFSPYDLAASAGYAYTHEDLGGFSTGFAGKFIASRVLATARTWALDAGILSPEYFGRLMFAATASNLGGRLKFEQESAPLPFVAKVGTSLKIAPGWLASADGAWPRDGRPYGAVGTEYTAALGGGLSGALRLGFNSRTIAGSAGFTGFSCGAGAALAGLSFDYAFVPTGVVGNDHLFSLTWRWGGDSAPKEPEEEPPKEEEKTAAPEDPFAKAAAAIAERDFRQARKLLGEAAEKMGPRSPGRARYYERLGFVQLEEGDAAEARATYVEGLELAKSLKLQGPLLAELTAGMGFALAAQNDAAYARKFLLRALALEPAEALRRRIEEKLKSIGP